MKTYTKGKKVTLTANFNTTELDCKGKGCCSKTLIDSKLVTYLQKIRSHFNKPISINSGYRCTKHNKAVGGASNSYHAKGKAADIVVVGVKPAEVAKYAESIGIKGIGLYETAKDGFFVHIDTRTIKSFWYGQAQAKRSTFGGTAQKYSGAFPNIKVTYYVTNKNGKKTKKTRSYLQKGDKGINVCYLQRFLNWYGNYNLTVDGDFGAATIAAVKKYQKAEKITVDGKFGAKSLSKAKSIKK